MTADGMDEGEGSGFRYRLAATEKPNQRHRHFHEQGVITLPRRRVFGPEDVFFTMGSCFAEEIRLALRARGLACVPAYREVAFDPADARIDELPQREHLNFYNSFTILQQIEEILGLRRTAPEDHWVVERGLAGLVPWPPPAYQDPYRRLVFGRTPEHLAAAVEALLRAMRRGFEQATAFVLTFGMAEVFINRGSGLVVAQKPAYAGGGGRAETALHMSSFTENLRNVLRIVKLLRRRKPDATIVVSVSPVPLERTFTETDIAVANAEGKAILRAVLGQVSREMEGVLYLPSYELVTQLGTAGGFRDDGRHVRRDVVDMIIGQFFEAYF